MTDVGLVLVVILILAIVWRGPKTLPKLGEALGRGVREARREATATREELSATGEPREPVETDPPSARG